MGSDNLMRRTPLFAVLRGLEPDRAVAVGQVLVGAGFDILEVTMNSPEPADSIKALVDSLGDAALIGAGTITTQTEIDAVFDAGGRLIVSPHCDPAIIRHAAQKGMTVLPGVLTPTDMMQALAAGATGLKIFPAEIMPPKAIKAVRAVLPPTTPIFVVGGINAENMVDYLRCGASGFGLGGSLFTAGKALGDIEKDAKAVVAAYHVAKGQIG